MNSALQRSIIRKLLVGVLCLAQVVSTYAAPGAVFVTGGPVKGPSVEETTEVPAETYAVSGRTGAAQYRFPIVVPPGRNGMAPSLELAYSSQNPLRGGVAAGWSMHIPSIRVDTSEGRLKATHYLSTLAGNQRLVRVDEPAASMPGAVPNVETYRAEHDASYLRYEYYPSDVPRYPGHWRALSPDGITYHFGQSYWSWDNPSHYGAKGRWFLSRMVDRFGNEVTYHYERVRGGALNGRLPSTTVDVALTTIEYTANAQAGLQLQPHARVRFEYKDELDLPPGSYVPIGAQFTYRNGIRTYEGARRLLRIVTEVRTSPAEPWTTRRQVDLGYDEGEFPRQDQPPQLHAPLRLLTSIQETAWSPDGPGIVLPAIRFTYGPRDHRLTQGLPLPTGNRPQGRRELDEDKAGGWPTVGVMWKDLDGDGRDDLLTSPSELTSTYEWRRNLGEGGFAAPTTGTLPTLPWRNTTATDPGSPHTTTELFREGCNLAYQFSRRQTADGDAHCLPANYTSHQFIDLNGDGLPDLVTATDSKWGPYNPAADADVLYSDTYGGPIGACPAPDRPCTSSEGPVMCMTRWDMAAPTFLAAADDPGDPGDPTDPGDPWDPTGPGTGGCPSDQCPMPGCTFPPCPCGGQYCGTPSWPGTIGSYYDPPEKDGSGEWAWPGPAPSPGEMEIGREEDDGHGPGTKAACLYRPERACQRYVWRVSWNLGGGQFSEPEIHLSPIPLETDRMVSHLGGEPESSFHGFHDMDGDRCVDAVWQHPFKIDKAWPGDFQVFLGNCRGDFVPGADGRPYLWTVPKIKLGPFGDGPRVFVRQTKPLDPVPMGPGEGRAYRRETRTLSSLADINGDGLPDLVVSRALTDDEIAAGKTPLRVFYNTGVGFEDHLEPFTGFGTILSDDVATLARDVMVVFKHYDFVNHLEYGYGLSTLRSIDLDGDGLADIVRSKDPEMLQANPWAEPPGFWSIWAHRNVGDRFLTGVVDPRLEEWRPGLVRIQVSDGKKWWVSSDFRDFSGDGVHDLYNNEPGLCSSATLDDVPFSLLGYGDGCREAGGVLTDPRDGQAMRLLRQIDNGQGGTITFEYAPSSDETVVQTDPAAGKRSPDPVWVVHRLTVEPGAGPAATTTYQFAHPVTTADARGQYGFRGFERVVTTHPATEAGELGKTEERFDYGIDYSGRLTDRVVYHGDGTVAKVSSTHWRPFGLFFDAATGVHAVTTVHPTEAFTWTCGVAHTTEESCRLAGAVHRRDFGWRARLVSTWVADGGEARPLPSTAAAAPAPPDRVCAPEPAPIPEPTVAVLYARCGERRTDSRDADKKGDRLTSWDQGLVYDPDRYWLLPTQTRQHVALEDGAGHNFGAVELVGRTRLVYDETKRVPRQTWVYVDATTPAVTERTFDLETGTVLAIKKPQQVTAGSPAVTAFTYDAYRLFVKTATNEVGHAIETDYDLATGARLETRGPNRKVVGPASVPETTKTVVDGFGRPLERWASIDDDATGYRLVRTAGTTYFDFETPRRVRAHRAIDPDSSHFVTTDTRYDGLGRILSQTTVLFDPDTVDSVDTYAYSPAGKLVRFTTPDPSRNDASVVDYTYRYDAVGRLRAIRRPDGSCTHFTYDGLQRTRSERVTVGTECVVDLPGSATTRLVADPFGRLVAVEERLHDGTFAATSYAYDANDNLTTIVNADGIITDMGHDFVGRRQRITRGGRVWTYAYDLNGNLVEKTAPYPDGAPVDRYTTRMTYDDLNRIVTHRPAPLDLTPEERQALGLGDTQYRYDMGPNGVGRLSRADFPVGFIAYGHDARGNVAEETRHFDLSGAGVPVSDTRTTRRAYNALGLVTHVWHADGPTAAESTWTTTLYDKRGLPERVVWHTGTEDLTLAAYVRNVAGRVIRQDSPLQTRRWAYDPLGRMTQHELSVSGGSPLPTALSQSFGYDGVDEIQELTTFVEGIGPRTMSLDYDSQHQLRQVTDDRGYTAQFTYTPGGRLKSAVVAADPSAYQVQPRAVSYDYSGAPDAERLTALVNQADGTPYAVYDYDLAGNVVRRRLLVAGLPPQEWRFTYDGDHTQVRADAPDGQSESYFKARAGERMLALTRDAAGTPGRLRFWFGDTEIWYELAGGETKTWVHVALGQPVARIENRSQVEYSHHSHHGHLLLAVGSDGQLKTAYTYGPYGEVLDARGSPDDHLRRFNGEEYDALSGLLYYGFRSYDPLSLTWTQADPLSRFAPDLAYDEPRRQNLYAFSLNNSLRYFDPDGRQPTDDRDPADERDPTDDEDESFNFIPLTEGYVEWWTNWASPADEGGYGWDAAYKLPASFVLAAGTLVVYAADELHHAAELGGYILLGPFKNLEFGSSEPKPTLELRDPPYKETREQRVQITIAPKEERKKSKPAVPSPPQRPQTAQEKRPQIPKGPRSIPALRVVLPPPVLPEIRGICIGGVCTGEAGIDYNLFQNQINAP